MIYFGASLMICAALGLAGVMAQLHHNLIKAYHREVWNNPLTAPRTLIERRHLTRPCPECSFVASTRMSYTVPVDIPAPRVIDC